MRRQRGFTLIELLIVVAIIGIIAAIAIPNLLNAINRGRQKRSMSDIRSIATAMESYQVDWNFYPRNIAQGDGAILTLNAYVTPTYIRRIPQNDGWSNEFQIITGDTGQSYSLWSRGKGGAEDGMANWGGARTDFANDLVFSDGQFIQWPDGMQVN